MFIIYELGHVDELKKYFEKNPEKKDSSVIVALSIDIEEKLEKSSIPFTSAASYKKVFPEQLSNEDQMMETFFSGESWKQFAYRDIPLLNIFLYMFRAYLQVVRYYGMLLTEIIEAHQDIDEIKLFPQSEVISSTHGTLAFRELNVVVDCAKRIGEIKEIPTTILPPVLITASLRNSLRKNIYSLKRTLFVAMIRVWNVVIALVIRPRSKRFLVSDYWKNIESSVKLLKDSELIFLDRAEVKDISFRLLLRYRMRFVHITDFLKKEANNRIRENSRKFLDTWREMKKDMPEVFSWNGYSFDQLLLTAMEDIVLDFPRILSEIEGAYAFYEEIRPHVIELRASVSKQTHFSILPLVAKRCGIPSLELQHGLEYLGPGSWSRNHEAEYIAVYGRIVKEELIKIGYHADKLPIIGSPRFDENARIQKQKNTGRKLTILCISPDIRAFEIYDSYSASDYFTAIATALKPEKENVHIIVKLRPGPAQQNLLRLIIEKAFSGFSYRIAHNEKISEVCRETDLAISCFSTALLEILQFDIPVVIPALNPVDEQIVNFHFPPYSEAGALSIAYTAEVLSRIFSMYVHDREKIKESQQKISSFMANYFRFDGKSSERYATLMDNLAQGNKNI